MAGYSGGGLRSGVSTLADVETTMGTPVMRWNDENGNTQLVYPRGPMGYHTFMVHIGPDGKLRRIENVMDPMAFARIQKGMTKEQVLRVLGPPQPQWTVYFKARDELVWEWRFCNDWNQPARFDVLFDGTDGTVRTTQQWEEALHDPMAPKFCSRTLAQPLPTEMGANTGAATQ